MKAEHVLVESSLVPDAKTISATRRIVDDITSQVLDDADLGWRLAMAAHELLDNARKYGHEGAVRFRLQIDTASVTLCVENAGAGRYGATLLQAIGTIREAADPWAHYLTLLQRTALSDEGSGIGLARISAEGEMRLTASIDAADCVRVEARIERGAP